MTPPLRSNLIGEYLRELRQAGGLTCEAVGLAIGLKGGRAYISMIETGQRQVSLKRLSESYVSQMETGNRRIAIERL